MDYNCMQTYKSIIGKNHYIDGKAQKINEIIINGNTYIQPQIKGTAYNQLIAQPDLPSFSTSIQIPSGKKAIFNIEVVEFSVFDDISIVPTFVLTPLTYLGGVFYSISLLPEFWQKVSLANPIIYMVNAFRYGVLGISDINIAHAYLIVVLFVVVLLISILLLFLYVLLVLLISDPLVLLFFVFLNLSTFV